MQPSGADTATIGRSKDKFLIQATAVPSAQLTTAPVRGPAPRMSSVIERPLNRAHALSGLGKQQGIFDAAKPGDISETRLRAVYVSETDEIAPPAAVPAAVALDRQQVRRPRPAAPPLRSPWC